MRGGRGMRHARRCRLGTDVQLDIEWTFGMKIGHENCEATAAAAVGGLSVLKFRVIFRPSELHRCSLSHIVSSGFCLRFVSFLPHAKLGELVSLNRPAFDAHLLSWEGASH